MATQLDVVNQLINTFGGSRVTKTADTSALRQVLAQLQQQGTPEGQAAQLQALFQQAAGQIPGLQGAYANAVGARRGGNSAVQGALNKLMSQVTLAGQAQQTQNLQAQAQAAGALANATGTTTTKGNIGGAALNLLLAQGLAKGKKGLLGEGDDLFDGVGKALSGVFGGDTVSTASGPAATSGLSLMGDSSLGGPILRGSGLDFNANPGVSLDMSSVLGPDTGSFSLDNIDMGFDPGASGSATGTDFGGGGLLDELEGFGVFADGGLVGRDGQAPRGGDEEMAEERAQAKFDPGFTENVALDLLRNLMPAFADGGSVTLNAPGARRGTAQSVTPTSPTRMGATNVATPQAASSPTANSIAAQTGSDVSLDRDFTPNALAGGITSVATSPIGRILLGALNPGLGMVAGMVPKEDATREQALAGFALPALNIGLADAGLSPEVLAALNVAVRGSVGGNSNPGIGMSTAPDGMQGISLGDVMGTGGFSTAPQDAGALTGNVTTGYGTTGGSLGDGSRGFSTGGFGEGQYADGGKIDGPGTGVSDSIPAMLSDGEYVISKDVVDAVGVDFFDALQASLHTPAAQQRRR